MTVYISIDIEADGPAPLVNSMLSLGAAAFDGDTGQLLDTFSVNLTPADGASPDPETMAWWNQSRNAAALAATRVDPVHPVIGMANFVSWVEKFHKPVCVAYPAGFDFTFVYVYLHRYVGRSPFGFSAIDMKSYAAALLRLPFKSVTKQAMPAEWFGPSKHSHIAVEDAIEQGELWLRMIAAGEK